MEFKPSCFRDIEKYYRGTWVKFKEFGEKLFYVETVGAEEVQGTDEDGNSFVLYLVEEAPYTIEYVLPSRSIFTYRGDVHLLQRIPARQYQRGLSAGNTRIIAVPGGNRRDLTIEILKAFVNKQSFVSLKQALQTKGERGVPLTSRLSYHRGSQQLFVDCVCFGGYDSVTNTITLNPLFLPDIQELIEKDPFDVKVKCYE